MSVKQIHNAIVTRNQDDDLGVALRGGVFFEAPTIFDGEYPLPALPCYPYASAGGAGFFFVPQVGDEIEVEIEMDDGTFDTTDVELPEPRWRCMIYSGAADIAEEFKTNYTKRMGWKTNSGHILMFDDTEGEERFELNTGKGHSIILDDCAKAPQIVIRHNSGALIQIDKNGSFKFLAQDGGYIFIDAKTNQISGVSKDGSFFKLKDDVVLSDKAGNILTIKDGTIQAISTDEFIANSGVANIECGSVNLGKFAVFSCVISENLSSLFDAHFHATPVGLSGPPFAPITYALFDLSPPTAPTAAFVKLKGNLL